MKELDNSKNTLYLKPKVMGKISEKSGEVRPKREDKQGSKHSESESLLNHTAQCVTAAQSLRKPL